MGSPPATVRYWPTNGILPWKTLSGELSPRCHNVIWDSHPSPGHVPGSVAFPQVSFMLIPSTAGVPRGS